MPIKNNYPECSEQYWEFRQSQANRRSIHARDECHHNMDRHLKNRSVHDRLENELLIKIELIMKKKVMRKNMFGRKANGVQKVKQEARKEECNA